VIKSDWLWNTPSYTPSGLEDDTTYYWCATARDYIARTSGYDNDIGPRSAVGSFHVGLPRMGARSYWPMWSDGAIAVNESTGNLVLSAPGPSVPTAAGTIGGGFTFNLLDKRPTQLPVSNGVGAWTFADGANSPAKLIDHQKVSGNDHFDAVEVVSGDGSSDWYGHVANSSTYQSSPGDPSVLVSTSSGYQLTEPDGSIYTYGLADSTTGLAPMTSAEVYTAKGQAHLDYAFSGGQLTSITAVGKDGSGTDQTLAKLTFNWACSGALLCITTPDSAAAGGAYDWKYVGASGRVAPSPRCSTARAP
jgi:hypothetical protein